jgi:hypothetical protein
MEQKYWLGRKRASGEMARKATSAEARLIHLELAGRYSIRAATCTATPLYAAAETPPAEAPVETGRCR